ncbi:hypothetical protein F2P81_016089 [Scophthalmus maximus]|uniref:Uncharacterized protein n=1 Tax=Scophthalmus maximus TaxID=52904 RepID=A0A6A4SKI9_SCOMX|nr:hypothetical protein F2P81_016089 [Scophthalmus maximus]
MEGHMAPFALLLCIAAAASASVPAASPRVSRHCESSPIEEVNTEKVKILELTAEASSQTCDPKHVNGNPWFQVRDMLPGCWTSFVTEDQAEVHILSFSTTHRGFNNSTALHYLINVRVRRETDSEDSFLPADISTNTSQMTGTAFSGEMHVLTVRSRKNKDNCHIPH